jgi:predicted DNA-binding protein (UPF0251 family)
VSNIISWIAAVAESGEGPGPVPFREEELRQNVANEAEEGPSVEDLPAHLFPAVIPEQTAPAALPAQADATDEWFEFDRRQRIYRGRTVGMLRRYMRYSLETGRLPSLLGREFFRSKVTSYRVTTFEDRVIFVHDMEICLGRLDELSRQVLARIVLQEYEHEEAAQVIGCARMTIHRRLLEALDKMSNILLAAGLLEVLMANP